MGTQATSSDESSSEDENREKFREAVWSLAPQTNETEKGGGRNVKVSKRVDVSEHEHDGNELQTTPEFRTHVSRKLAAMLDSLVSEGTSGSPDPKPEQCDEDQQDDAGFRLFSTSLPGRWWKESTPPHPSKHSLAPSSSDSDSEMELRLREAAVCVSDLLPFSMEKPLEKGEMEEVTKDSTVPTKKKKRKRGPTEEREEDESLSKADGAVTRKQRTTEEQSPEENVQKRRKKKKSKIKRLVEGV